LLEEANLKVQHLYRREKTSMNITFLILIISILLVIGLVSYAISSITKTLKEIKASARKIAVGMPGDEFHDMPNDVIGRMAALISSIDENNKQLASAAQAIGKGNFDVEVKPRSDNDMLGNAIVEMKSNLQHQTEELKASNKELERFAYVASHDLQEPLRMVSSFLHLVVKKLEGKLDDQTKQYIDFAVDGSDRMKVLIQDLLQYSRIGTNKEVISNVDCKGIMNEVRTILSVSIKESDTQLIVHELPVVKGVHTQILQLFQNLVANAIKYHGKEKPVIEIGYKNVGRYFEFYVKDNGIGIDPKFFDRIFIIFQRLHNKSEYSGTGIGLSICKKIVEKHGGKIRVESVPGKGSIFYFSLPKPS